MENLFLTQVVKELAAELSPGGDGPRVENVTGTAPLIVLVELGRGRSSESHRVGHGQARPELTLAICLDPTFPCLATLDRALPATPAPLNPDGFIETLSGALKGAVLTRVEQLRRDRVARLTFRRAADGGELGMWVELFGRRPVAVLTEAATGAVVASSREGVRSASGGVLHPGATYAPPVDRERTPVEELGRESLSRWVAEESGEDLSLRLPRRIEGLSPNVAQEIIQAVGGVSTTCRASEGGRGTAAVEPSLMAERLLEELKRRLTHPEEYFAPAVRMAATALPGPGEPAQRHVEPAARFGLALFPFGGAAFEKEPGYTVKRFATALEAVRYSLVQLCVWYRRAASRRLRADAASAQAKLERLRAALRKDMSAAGEGERLSRAGELILAHLKDIPRGVDSVELADVHDGGEKTVRVVLDPALSASQNADRYFKKARKAKRARELLEKRIGAVEHRLRALQNLASEIPEEVGPKEVGRLMQKLEAVGGAGRKTVRADAGRVSDRDGVRRASDRRRSPEGPAAHVSGAATHRGAATPRGAAGRAAFNPRVFTTTEGYTVIVGRNNNENDYVTHRLAKSEDLWFHAYGVTGSHVILRQKGKAAPSRMAIREAASIAAYYSKAKTSSQAPVIYTPKKFVHRPRGAKPGTAACAREKMVMARPLKPKVTESE